MNLAEFRVDVPDAVLDDLRRRLEHTRFPNEIDGIGWEQGTDLSYLRELVAYWRDSYDWRAAEARLNAHPQFVAEVDGQTIHVAHARSPEPDAMPLLLVHGWPGSVVEFLDVVGPLSDPRAHGGDAADAFHVVTPSLPGFGFSGPTHERGWHPRRIAAAFVQVMTALGYEQFAVQGGDWGSIVTANVADLEPERVIGLHLNFVTVRSVRDGSVPPLTPAEEADLSRLAEWRRDGAGYQEIQGTRPQTLGYALDDSPAGLCAWIVEKFRAWSDCNSDVEQSFTKDQLLDNVTVYWVTGTGASSARIYWEMRQAGAAAVPQSRIEVPTGIANFPAEISRMPRAWVERRYNVTHWSDQPRGGHFAAMEVPDLFITELRQFFRTVR